MKYAATAIAALLLSGAAASAGSSNSVNPMCVDNEPGNARICDSTTTNEFKAYVTTKGAAAIAAAKADRFPEGGGEGGQE